MTRFGGTLAVLCALIFSTVAWAQPERPVHWVVPGDTLYGIAATYGTTVDELRRINGLRGDLLRPGTEIALPGAVEQPVGYRPYLAGTDDTWDAVAVATERSVETLRSANPEVPAGAELAGRLLLVPPGEGVTHRVRHGESLALLAARIGMDAEALASLNAIDDMAPLIVGQPLLLPAALATAIDAAPAPEAVEPVDPRTVHRAAQEALLGRAATLLTGLSWPDTGFDMPVAGRLSSAFGWRNISVGGNRFHGGIDIAAPPGTPVRVARPGIVVRTGWIGAYGNAVYVDHRDGSQTRYAHLRSIDVQQGATVVRGDILGEVGSTGASTGPHLHFEVRIEGRAVDPLGYLDLR